MTEHVPPHAPYVGMISGGIKRSESSAEPLRAAVTTAMLGYMWLLELTNSSVELYQSIDDVWIMRASAAIAIDDDWHEFHVYFEADGVRVDLDYVTRCSFVADDEYRLRYAAD